VPPNLISEISNPFLTYNFLIKWDGKYVAAVTGVSGLTRRTRVVTSDVGGQPENHLEIPGQTDYEPVRLSRGITTDRSFEEWANLEWSSPDLQPPRNDTQLAASPKSMQIELYDQAGDLTARYNLYHCWPSEYTALPDLSGEANTVALASMTIEHEGWERDTSVVFPPSSDHAGTP
jgi:phage tail-like protein